MKKYTPLDGLRWSRNSDSALNNMPQTDVLGRAGGGNKDLGYFSRCLYLWICTKLYRILPKEMLYWWWRRNARKRHELMND